MTAAESGPVCRGRPATVLSVLPDLVTPFVEHRDSVLSAPRPVGPRSIRSSGVAEYYPTEKMFIINL